MARTADGRKKKRQKLIGSDSSAKDAKMHEETPASMKQDRLLRHRSKESPPEVAKSTHVDATKTTSSLQQQETTKKSEEKGAKDLHIISGQRSGPHNLLGSRKKAKGGSPDVDDLRLFVGMLGGVLEDGWQVAAHRRHDGKLTKTFISPSNEKFRSRVEVVKHLGLEANLLNKGEINKSNNGVMPLDHNEEPHVAKETNNFVTPQDKDILKSSLHNFSHVKDSGKRKELSSKLNDKAIANTDNGLNLASKAIVDVQKAPESSTVTQRCQDALRNIVSTDTFAALSSMLNWGSSSGSLESPLQLNTLPLIAGSMDLQLIHVRLSNGVYGHTPELFSADIQQVWKSITAAGNELVTLAHALSEFSDKLYKQQILSLFQDGTSKEISERKGLPPSTSQHGKQCIEDSGVSLDNSHILQESQLVMPPESTIAIQAGKGTPRQEKTPPPSQAARGSTAPPKSLSKKVGEVPNSSESKRWPKKMTKSKRLKALEMKAADRMTPEVCRSCGLAQGKDSVVCRVCNGVFHTHCMDLPSDSLPDNEWCCPSCAANKNMTEEVDKSEALKTSSRTSVCEACKKEDDSLLLCDACEAAYHLTCLNPTINSVANECWYCPTCAEKSMTCLQDAQENHGHPNGRNGLVSNPISKDTPLSNENTSTKPGHSGEHGVPENPCLEGPGHSAKYGAPKHVIIELESPEASVENVSPEPGFLLGNENACKVCGVESTKSAVSCAWCSKRFHLSCLRPALKKLPRKAWYCPSCLCRVCKVDADDDEILLCDNCDEGYHTYCLNPLLSEKPEGTWFCPSCTKERVPNSPRQTEVLKRKRKSTEPRRST